MKKTLVVFAHPYLEHSNSNVELINFYVRHQHFTLRDLYEEYPDFHIAAFRERKRLQQYDRFIFQFPIIWFGIPPLLKLWIDEVLDRNWLTGEEINPLENKDIYIVVTTGGKERSFSKNGTYKYTIDEIISGLIVSLNVFKANVKDITVVYEAHKLSKKEIILQKKKFVDTLNQ
ncbi:MULTISPECIES: NAD(P)H-dependent oxidoreductase [Chryseobacterium]|uniref:NAD(P)H-dependent oxidoreductase n=1 Tax=Chryseobacterium oryzae TaxID=2929799 RepID=A0ABY4BLA3_9FLAO|nr:MULTISPECIES: NAD(P)H-dependent oxidoreductase [Chryseobacterium]UOE38651.1 NAD(P)H-dependent oxidoreductase [Chryseobacterium oryzae]